MDNDDDEGVSQELLIERAVLDDLRNEVQKLLTWKKLTSVSEVLPVLVLRRKIILQPRHANVSDFF